MSIQIHVADHVLLEDPYIIVLHKPCGLMVEPNRNGHLNLLFQVRSYLKANIPSNVDVYAQHIHRLDRPVSGIILFAKQRIVLKNLSEQFAERRVKKYYQALTTKAPTEMKGRLESWHRKEKKKAIIYQAHIEWTEKVILDYDIERISADQFFWNIELHTGKYHQIRAQLADINCPIIGDSLYGSTSQFKPNAIALHAHKLIFSHPLTDQTIVIECQNNFHL